MNSEDTGAHAPARRTHPPAQRGTRNRGGGVRNLTADEINFMPHPKRACEAILGSADGKLIFQSMIHALENKQVAKAA